MVYNDHNDNQKDLPHDKEFWGFEPSGISPVGRGLESEFTHEANDVFSHACVLKLQQVLFCSVTNWGEPMWTATRQHQVVTGLRMQIYELRPSWI